MKRIKITDISASGTHNFFILNRTVHKVNAWPSGVKPGGRYSNTWALNGCDRRIMQ
jgi:hypothetical protein